MQKSCLSKLQSSSCFACADVEHRAGVCSNLDVSRNICWYEHYAHALAITDCTTSRDMSMQRAVIIAVIMACPVDHTQDTAGEDDDPL